MNCKVCGKDIFEHSKTQAVECLAEAGFKAKGVEPMGVVSQVSVPISVNYRHKAIGYNGEQYIARDVDTDLLRFCLLGKNIPEKKKKEPEPIVEEKKEWKTLPPQEKL